MQSKIALARYAPQVRDRAVSANIGLALCYVFAGWIGLHFTASHPSIADLWPASGLALAAVLLGGLRLLPGIALGALIVGLATTGNIWVSVLVMIGSGLEAWLGFTLLQRVPRFSTRLSNVRSVTALLGISALSPMPAALIGPWSLYGAGKVAPHELCGLISTWWLGDFLAMLLVTPVLLSWWGNASLDLSTRRLRAPLWFLPILAVVSFGVLDGRLDWIAGSTSSLYLLFPFVILLALGENIRLCTLGNLIVLGFAFWGLSRGHGPFTPQGALPLQFVLTAIGVTSMLVVALSSDRARALHDSERALNRFRSLTTLSADWYWESDAQHRFTFLSERYEEKSGLRLADTLGKTRHEIPVNCFESEASKHDHSQTLTARRPFHDLILKRIGSDGVTRWASVSGEPEFSHTGEFQGYRGVGHDITASRKNALRIEESERFLDALINAIASPVLVKDESHRYIAANAAFSVFFSRPLSETLGKTDADFFLPEKAEYFRRTDTEAFEHGHVKYEAAYPIGARIYWMHVRKSSVTLPDGRRIVVLIMMDVTERKAVESRLRDSEQRFRDFAEAAGDYAFEIGLDGRFTYCSARGSLIWGYPQEELVGRKPSEFMPEEETARVREWLGENLREDGSFRDLQHRVVTKQGEERWVQVNSVGMYDSQGTRIGQRGSGRDITDRKTVEDRINFLATRDALTGLPNRVLFGDRITQAIAVAKRTGQMVALFFMDLDRFKYINDSLGHDVGDMLLKQVAERMLSCVRKRDTLARVGGDEFVLALEGLQQAEDVAQVAAKIIRSVAQPIEIGSHTLTTSCSIGISIFPGDAEDDRTLMKNADTAMYHAKERGRNNFQFFSSDMNTRAVERNNLEVALRRSVENNDFVLHYQPTVDIRSGRLIGVEALLRWNHPEKGLTAPTFFIDVAEDCGLINPIGLWVLREACQCAKKWDLAGYPSINISVNVSSRQLVKPNEFARSLTRILADTELDPKRLELEVTEALLLHNADEIISTLRKLTRDGVRISVDDFGTGYSSLSYLRQFPIDSVKIDRTFVRDVDTNPEHASVIQAIVAMGHSLGLSITAEGVETRAQMNMLTDLGCDAYQGNLYSKPLPAIDIAAKFLAPGELDLQIAKT